jgi:hypothetical protein
MTLAAVYLIALFRLVAAIRIGKVNVTSGLLHDAFYIVATFADDVRMFGIRNFNLHRHSGALAKSKRLRMLAQLRRTRQQCKRNACVKWTAQ